jgi:hypothetical protein
MDAAEAEHLGFSFDLAYKTYFFNEGNHFPVLYGDTLSVYASKDGGASWDRVYMRGGSDLAPNQSSSTQPYLNPAPDEWRRDSIELNQYAGDSLRLKFVTTNGFGNNLFLDNVKLDTTDFSPEQVTQRPSKVMPNGTHLYPNPTTGAATLHTELAHPAEMQLEIRNMQGQVIRQRRLTFSQAGYQRIPVDVSSFPAGLYMVRVAIGTEGYTHKLVKQ